MMFYVETGVQFAIYFGGIDEGVYTSMERTNAATLAVLKKEN